MRKTMLLVVMLAGMVLVQGCIDEEEITKRAEKNIQQLKEDVAQRLKQDEAEHQRLEYQKEIDADALRIQEMQEENNAYDKRAEERNRKPDYDVYASGISKEYEDNEVRADAKYGGRRVIVRGKINNISLSMFGSGGYIVLEGHDWLSGVHCQFKDASVLANFSKGQSVSIWGTVGKGGTTMGSVILKNCQKE